MTKTLTFLEGTKQEKMALTESTTRDEAFLKRFDKETRKKNEDEEAEEEGEEEAGKAKEDPYYQPVSHNHLKQGLKKKCAGFNSATLWPGGHIADRNTKAHRNEYIKKKESKQDDFVAQPNYIHGRQHVEATVPV